jgi:uncharacterized membrane protein
MSDAEVEATAGPPEIETMDHEQALAHLRSQQRFGLAVAAGLGSALVGAILWAVIVYITEYQLGLVAIAVGALVGISVREAGQGVDMKFGILGAACAALGWLLGTVMVDVAMLAKVYEIGFFDALGRLGVGDIIELLKTTSDAMDLLFLAIAVYEGYRFAFRYKIG